MIRYFSKALGAHFRAGKSLYVLTVFGVALGVASVLSIQIINRNALAAFEGSVTAVSGESDLSVLGRTPTFPERLYPVALATKGVRGAWPLYRTEVMLKRETSVEGERVSRVFLSVIGVDFYAPMDLPWAEKHTTPRLRSGQASGTENTEGLVAEYGWDSQNKSEFSGTTASGTGNAWLWERGWCAVTPVMAERMGWETGDSFEVAIGSRMITLTVGALIDFQALSPLASPKLVAMDISQAQALFGRAGEIHQIDITLDDGANVSAVQADLQRRLGAAVRVVTPTQRGQQAEGLLSAFRLNLTALSLISLFVGLFLVYSSTQASLIRRREEFGLLRSIGGTPRQVFAIIVVEVALLGALGVGFGLPMGYWVAKANVDMVSATLSNLYLLEEISTLEMPWWLYAMGAAIGIGGATAGAVFPALDMSRRDTRSLLAAFTLHEKIGTLAPRLFIVGVLLPVISLAWYLTVGHVWKHAGFAMGVGLLVGLPLLAPQTIRTICDRIHVRSFGLGYSLRGLGVRLQTTAFAVASLAIAVSMLIGITLMIGSFRQTLEVWIGTSIQADIYVAPTSWRGKGSDGTLDAAAIQVLTDHPAVAAVDRLRGFIGYAARATGPEDGTMVDQRIGLAGVEMGLREGEARFPLLQGDPEEAYRMVTEDEAVFIGETLARKLDVWAGDDLSIYTADGARSFPIAAVYYDYSTEGGAAVMDLRTMEKAFGPGGINSVALYLKPGQDPEQVVDELKSALPDAPLQIRSNRRLREQVFKIFDQTFAVTQLLKGMSLVIAICGITLMLIVLAHEQVSELALYRSIGATRGQLFRVYVGKGLGMGAFGLLLGLFGGVLLAGLLIFVINRAYFGWTIQPSIAWGAIAQQCVTILGAATLASLYPALRASRTPATELSRENL